MAKSSSKAKERQGKTKKSKSVTAAESQSARLEVALECAKIGMRVGPLHGTRNDICTCGDAECDRSGRHLRTPNGFDDATSNPDKIKEFSSDYPKAKFAIATGIAGMIALKVTGEAAHAAVAEDLKSTRTVEISDGKSTFFLLKVRSEYIPEGSVLLSKGVRILGRDRFIVAPNELASKTGLHFVNPPGGVDIADAPGCLLARLCARRHGINPKPWSAGSTQVKFECKPIDMKCLVGAIELVDPGKVERHMRSIEQTGPRMPPAVRVVNAEAPLYQLLTERCQVEALKSLGATTIDCIVVEADTDGGWVWQIAELFNQPQKTVLEKAELATICLENIQSKGGQVAQPKGGHQPKDRSMSTTSSILGISRRDLGRFEKIAAISDEAKTEILGTELENIQSALEEIARAPRDEQVAKVLERKEWYSTPRGTRSAAAKSAGTSKASAGANEDAEETGADEPTDTPAKQAGDVGDDTDESDTDSPPTALSDNDEEPEISPKEREKRLRVLKCLWEEHLAPEWKDTDTETRVQFKTEVLGLGETFSPHKEATDFVRKTIEGRQWIHAKEVYANTDEHGFSRKAVRGALASLGYRLKKKGRENYGAWIYKSTDRDFSSMTEREPDEDEKDYFDS
jgi:Bifunctional DNA primase/polymerase, N-terminal